MYRAPFHRQILPWLFIAIFLALAPVLVFYTAGYRYNSKKGQIERNGTLIVDSFPKGAQILMDGQDTNQVTPYTFQNITPGRHTVLMQKTGFHSWEKTLDVTSERVTFANRLWLWRESDPVVSLTRPFARVEADALRDKLVLTFAQATSAELSVWTADGTLSAPNLIPGLLPTDPFTLRFHENGQSLLVNGLAPDDRAWWASLSNQSAALQALPVGIYRWSGNELLGTDNRNQFILQPRNGSLTRNQLPSGIMDQENNYFIERNTSTGGLSLIDKSFRGRSYELPKGDWRFAEIRSHVLLFKNGDRWLAFDPSTQPTTAAILMGTKPQWLADTSVPTALFVHGNELWSWRTGENPLLLWRQSEPLVKAAWHRSGDVIFIATKQRLFALDLDERNGRIITDLATFDEIHDFDILDKTIVIAGKKDGQDALWSLQVE